jgi:hypothetical protein
MSMPMAPLSRQVAAEQQRQQPELAGKGDDTEQDDVAPDDTRVKSAKVGLETREDKVLIVSRLDRSTSTHNRKEEHGDQVFDLLGNGNGKAALVGDDQARKEATEDGVNTC